ncbi:hypothetical protein QFZ82_002032 [Streptomyces sp. V4I23]|nr:hypothetical protein [Streptomyces sp. V4I23]
MCRRETGDTDPTVEPNGVQIMEQHKVFSPIAEQGQLAHLSATHSNALVENPFDDAVEADSDK